MLLGSRQKYHLQVALRMTAWRDYEQLKVKGDLKFVRHSKIDPNVKKMDHDVKCKRVDIIKTDNAKMKSPRNREDMSFVFLLLQRND
jgi:hypothetical protein